MFESADHADQTLSSEADLRDLRSSLAIYILKKALFCY